LNLKPETLDYQHGRGAHSFGCGVSRAENPALTALVSEIRDELAFAQVLIRRRGARFELRHIADRSRKPTALESVRISQLRRLAQFTLPGAFRPLKSAPNLRVGWKCAIRNTRDLEAALNHLYPGAIADWHAARRRNPPVTNYREFTNRQSGMYRITQKLSDMQAAGMIRACCDPRFCLKRRLWTVQGLAQDPAAAKSLIPCLQPCAVLLEFARKIMRIEQEAKARLALAPSDLRSVVAALQSAMAHGASEVQDADMNSPLNPRRIQRLLQALQNQNTGPPEQ